MTDRLAAIEDRYQWTGPEGVEYPSEWLKITQDVQWLIAEIRRLNAENGRLLVELTHRVGWQERCLRAEAELERLQERIA